MNKNAIALCMLCMTSINAMNIITSEQLSYDNVKKIIKETLPYEYIPLDKKLKEIDTLIFKTKRPKLTFQSLLEESNEVKKVMQAVLYRCAVEKNNTILNTVGNVIKTYCMNTIQLYNTIEEKYIDTVYVAKKIDTKQWLKQSIAVAPNKQLCMVSTTVLYSDKHFTGRKTVSIIPHIENDCFSMIILFDSPYKIENEWRFHDFHQTFQESYNVVHCSARQEWLENRESTDICTPYLEDSFIIGYKWGGFEILLKEDDVFKRKQYMTNNTISALCCSPDGESVVIGSDDGTIAVYIISTDQQTKEKNQLGCCFNDYYHDAYMVSEYKNVLIFKDKPCESIPVKHVHYVHNNTFIFCIGRIIYSLINNDEIHLSYKMQNVITSIHTTTDQFFCGLNTGKVIIISPHKRIGFFSNLNIPISSLSVSSNDEIIVIGFTNGIVQIWDLKKKMALQEVQCTSPVSFVLYTPTTIVIKTIKNLALMRML